MPIRVRDSIALASVITAGCGSYTTYQTAEPLPRGRWQGAAALGPGVFVNRPGETRTPSAHVELAARRGLGSETDIGLKLYGLGIEGSVRHRLLATRAGWSIASLIAIGGLRSRGDGLLADALAGHVRTAGAFTRRTSPRWAFTFGPVATASLFVPAGGGHATGVLVGVFGNAEWSFGSRRWHVMPELSLHRSALGDVPVDGTVAQLGIGLARDL